MSAPSVVAGMFDVQHHPNKIRNLYYIYGPGISSLNNLQLLPIPPKKRKQITLSIK